MTVGWIWLDDLMPEHPKILSAGPAAAWLHICAIAYSNRHRTDGFVPAAKLAGLGDVSRPQKVASALVTAGLWHEVDGGYTIHDYGEYQLTNAERALRAEAGRKGARKRWPTNGTGHSPRNSSRHGGAKA